MARGRPREFDPDLVLDRALEAFARDGFEATSVQALADAMGICKPSLYAAYGNKEGLFVAALGRYAAQTQRRRADLLEHATDARTGVEAVLLDVVESDAACDAHRGCLLVTEASSGVAASQSAPVRTALAMALTDGRAVLVHRLARARDDGELPADVSVDALADYFGAVMMGLSVASRGGAGIDTQRAVVAMAMRAWPDSKPQAIKSRSSARSTTLAPSRVATTRATSVPSNRIPASLSHAYPGFSAPEPINC
jgi:TetR/AcrR family transcriptional regulator, copper-responsive repressor